MAEHFTARENAEMFMIYWETAHAARHYNERFPDRIGPSPRTIVSALRFMHTGTAQPQAGREGSQGRHLLNEEKDILELVANDPSLSTRRIALRLNVSHNFIAQVVRNERLDPYHIQRVQALLPDHLWRVAF
ncbi:hypothetical protein JTB14_010512 [Gonioctena quinquepunctata]|nr:hypothetical protein JTB14_010512 [Gonioctena quinquepunctata]